MPDPTPTRDAGPLHDLLCAYDEWLNGEDSDDTIRWHATEFLRSAVSAEHRAALAASPAPTDNPDERPCTESHGFRWAPPHTHAHPAAVTAPCKDERDALHDRLKRVLGDVPVGTRDLVNVLVGPDVAPWTARVLAAAAPAVERTDDPTPLPAFRQAFDAWRARPTQDESTDAKSWVTGYRTALRDLKRATPDPDTLAALLREHLRPIHVAGIPDRVDDLAHALTAAGITYTPRGPAARVEELHRERLRYQLGAGNEAGVTITPPTTGQGHTAP